MFDTNEYSNIFISKQLNKQIYEYIQIKQTQRSVDAHPNDKNIA